MGISLMELILLPALTHLVSSFFPIFFVCRLPQPIPLPISRSQAFACFRYHAAVRLLAEHASHFALAYRVTSSGATGDPASPTEVTRDSSAPCRPQSPCFWWVNENAFGSIPQARPCPTLGRPLHLRGGAPRLRPGTSPHALQIPPHGGHPALRELHSGGFRSAGLCPTFVFVPV
jgi:hypothetical protein